MTWGIPIVLRMIVGGTSGPTKKGQRYTRQEVRHSQPMRMLCFVESWLSISMDPICGMEQKGNKYWEKIHKHYHEHKEYVEPKPSLSTTMLPWFVGIKVGLESIVT